MKKKKTGIIFLIVSTTMYFIILFCGIHICGQCGELYFGKSYNRVFDGQEKKICEECYDFYLDSDVNK